MVQQNVFCAECLAILNIITTFIIQQALVFSVCEQGELVVSHISQGVIEASIKTKPSTGFPKKCKALGSLPRRTMSGGITSPRAEHSSSTDHGWRAHLSPLWPELVTPCPHGFGLLSMGLQNSGISEMSKDVKEARRVAKKSDLFLLAIVIISD